MAKLTRRGLIMGALAAPLVAKAGVIMPVSARAADLARQPLGDAFRVTQVMFDQINGRSRVSAMSFDGRTLVKFVTPRKDLFPGDDVRINTPEFFDGLAPLKPEKPPLYQPISLDRIDDKTWFS